MITSFSLLMQWVEESFTDFQKGINWRSYVVCDVAYNNVNNWLWTPFIERKDANRIYIEVKFSMRDCNLFPGKFIKLACTSLCNTDIFYFYSLATSTFSISPTSPPSLITFALVSSYILHLALSPLWTAKPALSLVHSLVHSLSPSLLPASE